MVNLSAYYVPGITLSTLHRLTHFNLHSDTEVSTIIIPIFQMRKLRHRVVKHIEGHT